MHPLCPDCAAKLNAFGCCDNTPVELAVRGIRYCGGNDYQIPHPYECDCERCRLTRKIVAA